MAMRLRLLQTNLAKKPVSRSSLWSLPKDKEEQEEEKAKDDLKANSPTFKTPKSFIQMPLDERSKFCFTPLQQYINQKAYVTSSSTPISKRNTELLKENANLKKTISIMQLERENLLNVFERLKQEYSKDKNYEKYDERRYIMLKSMIEQKDRFIKLVLEAKKDLYQLWKEGHDIIELLMTFLKDKEKLIAKYQKGDKALQIHSQAFLALKESEDIKLTEEEKKLVREFEHKAKKCLSDYNNSFSTYNRAKKNLGIQNTQITNHIGDILIHNEENTEAIIFDLETFDINKKKLLKLESDLSILLNSVLKKHQATVEKAEGVEIANLPAYLTQIGVIRDCAEGVLDLASGCSIFGQKNSNLSLNPYYPIFAKCKCLMTNIVANCYNEVTINDALVTRMFNIAFKEKNPNEKKRKILTELTQIRNHEYSLILSRHLFLYENKALNEIIQEIDVFLGKLDGIVENVMNELDNNCKGKLMQKIDKIVDLNGEINKLNEIEAKVQRKGQWNEMLEDLSTFVQNSFQTESIKNAKAFLKTKMDELLSHKILIQGEMKNKESPAQKITFD